MPAPLTTAARRARPPPDFLAAAPLRRCHLRVHAVLANGMAALGLMVATRLTAFLVLLIMHRLKKI